MKTRTLPRKSAYVLVAAILVTISYLAGGVASKGRPVNAQGANVASNSATPDGSFECMIDRIAVWGSRMHVRCSTGVGDIVFFAAPLTSVAESRQANRFLSILISAAALNKSVWVWYNEDLAFNPPGCGSNDCRLLEAVIMR